MHLTLAAPGTGGCVAGVGKFLKDKNPACKVVALEPSEARIHIGAPMGKHGIATCAKSKVPLPPLGSVVPQLASCGASGRAWRPRAARHSQGWRPGHWDPGHGLSCSS